MSAVARSSSRQENRRNMMINDPIPSLVTKMSIPTIISALVMSFYNIADAYFVSSIGLEATAAIGVNFSLMNLIQMFGMVFGMGANSYIARLLGAKRDKEAASVLSVAFFMAMGIGIVVMISGLFFIHPLVSLLGAKDPIVAGYSVEFASFVLFASPFMTPVFVLNHCLRSEGSATFSMIGIVSGSVINLALAPLFIYVFKWGVSGAGAATAISKFISFCVLLTPYLRGRTLLPLSIRNFRPTKTIMLEISKMGFPSLLRSGLMTVANIITNNIASSFSAVALAAISVVNRLMMFLASAVLGFGQGYQPVAGFNWGAKRYDRVWKAFKFSSVAGILSVSGFAAIFAIFAPQIMLAFTDNPEAISIGTLSIRLQCLVMPIHAWVIVVNMTFAGLGRATAAAILGLARQGICFIPSVAALSIAFGVRGLASAQAAADLLSVFIAAPLAWRVISQLKQLIKQMPAENEVLPDTPAETIPEVEKVVEHA